MNVQEAAEALGISKSAVRKAIARGKMNATVIVGGPRGSGTADGYYVVSEEEVERYRTQHLGRMLGRAPKASK